jgi:hypothetical protein
MCFAEMNDHSKLRVLLDLAESLGLRVRRAPASGGEAHPGGALVRLRGEEVLFLDPMAAVGDQLAVAAEALRGRPELDEQFIPPALRELLE